MTSYSNSSIVKGRGILKGFASCSTARFGEEVHWRRDVAEGFEPCEGVACYERSREGMRQNLGSNIRLILVSCRST